MLVVVDGLDAAPMHAVAGERGRLAAEMASLAQRLPRRLRVVATVADHDACAAARDAFDAPTVTLRPGTVTSPARALAWAASKPRPQWA